jgi:hypothetical protein
VAPRPEKRGYHDQYDDILAGPVAQSVTNHRTGNIVGEIE